MSSRGPEYFNFGGLGAAQPEVQALVVCRFVTSGGGGEARLAVHQHARAETIAVAARAAQGDRQPVRAAAAVVEKLRMFAQCGGDDVDPAIVVQVAECRAASRQQRAASGVGLFESSIVIEREEGRLQIMQ